MKLSRLTWVFLLALPLSLSGCKAVQQAQAFLNCDFSLTGVRNPMIAGINVAEKQGLTDFGVMEMATLGKHFLKGDMPMELTALVNIDNPNAQSASLMKLDWIAQIDDTELARGTTTDKISVPANAKGVQLPLKIMLDLKEVSQKDGRDNLVNFGLNLAGAGDKPTKLKLRVRPYFNVGGASVGYPGYIAVKQKVGK